MMTTTTRTRTKATTQNPLLLCTCITAGTGLAVC